jgi:integrase
MAYDRVTPCRVRGEQRFKFEFLDPHGQRKTRFFQSEGDAQVYRSQRAQDGRLVSLVSPEAARNFDTYARHWLSCVANGYAPTTMLNYNNALLNHIIPCRLRIGGKQRAIGDLHPREHTWAHVEAFFRCKTEGRILEELGAYKRNTLIGFLTAWSACLNGAVDAKIIGTNPLHGRRPKTIQMLLAERRDVSFLQHSLNQEQAGLFLRHARDAELFVPIVLMLDAGLRIGEACGLQLADISIEGKRIHVQRQRTQSGTIKPPKWNSVRMVDLTDRLAHVLRPLIEGRRALAMAHGWRPVPPWVCLNPEGGAWSQHHVARATKAVLRNAGLAGFTPHSLRHTFGRLHAVSGCSMKWLQEQMGHRSIETTMRYTTGAQFSDPDAAMRLERLVPGR